MQQWQDRVRRPETFIYLAVFVLLGTFFVLRIFGNSFSPNELFLHYIKLNSASLWGVVVFLIGVLSLWLVRRPVKDISSERTAQTAKDLLFAGIPIGIALYVLLLVLAQLNALNKARLHDELLFKMDTLFTDTFPALTFASFSYPDWFVEVTHLAFVYLWLLVFIFFIFVLQRDRKLFLEAAGVLSFALVLMLVVWLAFPALSPHDRFIDNVYELPIPREVQVYIDAYAPHEEVVEFLTSMRTTKEGLTVFPTNTFPSVHVAGVVGLVYYAWRLRRWIGYVIMPLVIFSSFGAVLFAQHYFVDLVAGVLISVVSIWFVRFFIKKENP